MPAFVERVEGYIRFTSSTRLAVCGAPGQVAAIALTRRDIAKPFFRQFPYPLNRDRSGNNENGIGRTVIFEEKGFLHLPAWYFQYAPAPADRHPAIGMTGIGQFPHPVPDIAVGFGDVVF